MAVARVSSVRIDRSVTGGQLKMIRHNQSDIRASAPTDVPPAIPFGVSKDPNFSGEKSGIDAGLFRNGRMQTVFAIVLPATIVQEDPGGDGISRSAGSQQRGASQKNLARKLSFLRLRIIRQILGLRDRYQQQKECKKLSHGGHFLYLKYPLSRLRAVMVPAFVLLVLSFAGISALAQGGFTTVTGTIVDPNGIPYACGTISAQLITAGGAAPTLNGQGFSTSTSPVNLGCQTTPGTGAPGSFVMRLADSGVIVPGNTTWKFTVNENPGILPPAGTGPQSFSFTTAINCSTNTPSVCTSNTIDISTQLSALAPKLSNIAAGAIATIVTSNPGTCSVGQVFFNTTSGALLICSATNTLTTIGGLGTVTSVGLALPQQFVVSGSPVTGAGTLTGTLAPEPSNTVFAGPTPNSIGSTFDGVQTATSSGVSTTLPITITPVGTHDLAFFLTQSDPNTGSSVAITGGGVWTSLLAAGGGELADLLLANNNPLTATATFAPATNSTGMIFLLRAVGTPTVLQTANVSGSISTGATATFPGNTSGGTILVVILGGSTGLVNPIINDSQGNSYTPISITQTVATGGIFTQTVAGAFLTTNIKSGVGDSVTFTARSGSPGLSGEMFAVEISGLSTPSPIPTFRPLTLLDLPLGVAETGTPFVSGNCVFDSSGLLVTFPTPCVGFTGNPSAGNLAQFSNALFSPTTVAPGDLTGDVTTSGSLATTIQSIQGVPVTGLKAVQAVNTNTIGTTTVNNTNTTIKTQTVTFPSSGCPCRAFLSYSLFLDFTGVTNQPNINFWVSDGSNVMAATQTGQSNAAVGAKTLASYGGFSTIGYANSAVVTFTLIGIQPGAAGATVQGSAATGSGSSTFQVTVLTSVN
jgi:hypothetical protein